MRLVNNRGEGDSTKRPSHTIAAASAGVTVRVNVLLKLPVCVRAYAQVVVLVC